MRLADLDRRRPEWGYLEGMLGQVLTEIHGEEQAAVRVGEVLA